MSDDDSDIVFEVRMDRRTFNVLRTALAVRAMAHETAGVIEAFANRFVTCVDEGKRDYYFKLKKDPT